MFPAYSHFTLCPSAKVERTSKQRACPSPVRQCLQVPSSTTAVRHQWLLHVLPSCRLWLFWTFTERLPIFIFNLAVQAGFNSAACLHTAFTIQIPVTLPSQVSTVWSSILLSINLIFLKSQNSIFVLYRPINCNYSNTWYKFYELKSYYSILNVPYRDIVIHFRMEIITFILNQWMNPTVVKLNTAKNQCISYLWNNGICRVEQ